MRFYAILFIAVFFGRALSAQEAPIYSAKTVVDRFTKFETYTTKDGLSDNVVTAIFQDSKGYLWLGTSLGLNRFDGYSFKVFAYSASDSLSISSNEVTSITEDKHGFLWVGTANGLNRLDVRTGAFTRFYADKSPKSLLKNSHVRALLYTSDGSLWADCKGCVLSRINLEYYTVRHFLRQGSFDKNYWFNSIVESRDGKSVIVGGFSNPIFIINKQTNSFEELKLVWDKSKNLNVASAADFTYDSKGNLWVGQAQDFMVMLDAQTGSPFNLLYRSRYAVKSDGAGNIWFGGYKGGLSRYSESKNEVTIFPYNEDNPRSVGGDRIYRIFCDRSGCTWIATDGGLSKYSPYANRYSHYFHIPEMESLPSNKVTCIAEGKDGILWLGTRDRGLVRFDRRSNRFETIGFDANNPNAIESPFITSIAIDSKGILWLSLWDGTIGGLNSYNSRSRKATRYSTNLAYRWFNDVAVGKNDEVYAGTWGCGLYFFDPKRGDYYDVINASSRGIYGNGSPAYSIVRDKDERIWFSIKGYPFYYNPILGVCENFFPAEYPKTSGPRLNYSKRDRSCKQQYPLDAYLPVLDAAGNPWFYSKSGTLIQYQENRPFRVLNLKTSIEKVVPSSDGAGFWICGSNKLGYYNFSTGVLADIALGLPTGEIHTVYEDGQCLLVGCQAGLLNLTYSKETLKVLAVSKVYSYPVRAMVGVGIYIYVGADNGFFRMNNNRTKVIASGIRKAPKNVFVHSLYLNSAKDLFVGTSNGLYYLLNFENRFIHYQSDSNSETDLHSNNVLSVAQDIKGLVWLGTDNGVATFDPSTQRFFTYDLPSNDALSSVLITDLLFDSSGMLWIGTDSYGGLNRVNLQTGHVDYYVSRPYYPKGLQGADIRCVFEDSQKRIWVGTELGLNLLLPNGRDFKHYDQKAGLPSNDVQSISEDSHGNLWVATLNGLSCIDPKTDAVRSYFVEDGAQHNIYLPRSVAKLRSGEIAFGGMGGFNLFNPDSIAINKTLPITGISGVFVNGKQRYYDVSSAGSISLKYSERNISFELASLDFHNPKMNRFSYKLEGLDTAWITTGASGHMVHYSNLAPGHYIFHVKSSNNDGVWGNREIRLEVVVGYPFWQRWWFIVLSLAFISAMVISISEIRERSLKRDKLLLETTVAQRTSELLAQSEEIISQRDALQRQHAEIERYHAQLSESIEFAKHLQDSHMQSAAELDVICGNHFLIYLPKYLVGGDFYWTTNVDDNVLFCLVDCTGHGVPGALMSMVGLVTIKDVVLNHRIYDPAQVLECVHQKIVSTLSVESPGDSVASAMDLAFCVLNRKSGKLVFSGAHCPIFIVRGASTTSFPSLQEISGDKRLVGSPLFRSSFTNHTIDVGAGDMIYLFTDGLVDQLEEHLRRKFSRSLAREMFTEVAHLSMPEQRAEILRRIMMWKGADTQTDDITVLGIKV